MVASKVCVLPKRSEVVAGATVTVIEEGVGGGWTAAELAPAPPLLPAQPTVYAAVARRARIGSAAKRGCFAL